MIGVLGNDEAQQATLQGFKTDLDVWEQFKAYPNKDHKMQLLERRSLFQKTSVQQYVQALNLPEVLFYRGRRKTPPQITEGGGGGGTHPRLSPGYSYK